jgi:hypothetical protein
MPTGMWYSSRTQRAFKRKTGATAASYDMLSRGRKPHDLGIIVLTPQRPVHKFRSVDLEIMMRLFLSSYV